VLLVRTAGGCAADVVLPLLTHPAATAHTARAARDGRLALARRPAAEACTVVGRYGNRIGSRVIVRVNQRSTRKCR